MVDKENERVVFAESNHEFVDILFSFLTMPLGTIVRILRKNSPSSSPSLGSLVNIYDSVAGLDSQYLHTEACKNMLLHPRSAAEARCEGLVINIDDTKPRKFYICQNCSLGVKCYSSIQGARCCCGKLMSTDATSLKITNEPEDRGFVRRGFTYIITDNLNVSLASMAVLMSRLRIEDSGGLEERVLDLGPEEITTLLQRSLISNNPLTDMYFNKPEHAAGGQINKEMLQPKLESDLDSNTEELKLKLILRKSDNKILCAEADEDMVDFLLSFLTLPLGFLIKSTKHLSKGCVVNLYKSVESNNLTKSEECKMMLLSPKLPAFHGCSSQLLKTEEMASIRRMLTGFYFSKIFTPQNYLCEEVNPKSSNGNAKPGGGYVKGLGQYMVTDDLHVSPLSLVSSIQMINESKVSVSDLIEREVSIGPAQAVDLLRASICSKTALSDVFVPVKRHKIFLL